MNFAIFYITSKLLHTNIKIIKIIFGAAITTAIYILSIISESLLLAPPQIVLGFISLVIGLFIIFGKENFMRAFIYAHALAFLIGGMVTALLNYGILQNFSFILLIISTIACYIFIILFKRIKNQYFTLDIYEAGEKVTLKAFLDTGNMLTYNGIPVVIINKGHFKTNILVPYKTITEEGFLNAFIPEKVTINEREIQSVIAISEVALNEKGKFNALIGPALIK